MARRGGCAGRESEYAVSKTSKVRPVRVVHISNPTMVKASVSEFRSVVQSLTGQKRPLATAQSSPTSSYASEEPSAYSDHNQAFKTAKLEDNKASCNNNNSNSSSSNSNSSGTELGDRDDAEHQRPEKHKVSAIEIHDIFSQQMLERPDGIEDNNFFGLEFFSPSFFTSDLDNLYLNPLM